jgi:hypothetical protein
MCACVRVGGQAERDIQGGGGLYVMSLQGELYVMDIQGELYVDGHSGGVVCCIETRRQRKYSGELYRNEDTERMTLTDGLCVRVHGCTKGQSEGVVCHRKEETRSISLALPH